MRALEYVLDGRLDDLVRDAEPSRWKDTLGYVCGYSKSTDFFPLCGELAVKLRRAGMGDEASLLEMLSLNVDATVGGWSAGAPAEDGDADVLEKISVYAKAFGDEAVLSSMPAVAKRFVAYAARLAEEGEFDLAATFASQSSSSAAGVGLLERVMQAHPAGIEHAQASAGVQYPATFGLPYREVARGVVRLPVQEARLDDVAQSDLPPQQNGAFQPRAQSAFAPPPPPATAPPFGRSAAPPPQQFAAPPPPQQQQFAAPPLQHFAAPPPQQFAAPPPPQQQQFAAPPPQQFAAPPPQQQQFAAPAPPRQQFAAPPPPQGQQQAYAAPPPGAVLSASERRRSRDSAPCDASPSVRAGALDDGGGRAVGVRRRSRILAASVGRRWRRASVERRAARAST